MTLYINTSDQEKIIIALKERGKVVAAKEFSARRSQAEKLLPAIDKLLRQVKMNLHDLKKIEVADYGSSFTALRIGVVTANALGYALKIPVAAEKAKVAAKKFKNFSVVKPVYDRPPNLG